MVRGFFIALLFLFISGYLYPQSLSFYKEKIEVIVEQNDFIVLGDYYFQNNSNDDTQVSLYYPYKITNDILYPDSVKVMGKNGEVFSYSKGKDGIFIPLKVKANDSSFFKVYYRQKNLTNKAEYILTSTQNWNHPLSEAEYVIKLPMEFKLRDISIKPFKEIPAQAEQGSYKTFLIKKQNFMPETNLIIEWERRIK